MTDTLLPAPADDLDSSDVEITSSWVGTFLYPKPADRNSAAILKWWERRRLAYNAIVGGAGLITTAALVLVTGGPPAIVGGLGALITPIAVYAVMANICFSLGPLMEILLNKIWGRDVLPVGPALWRSGLIFSVGLTLVFPLIILITGMVLSFFAFLF